LRVIIATLAGLAALATLAMLAGIEVDLDIARLFYDPARKQFLAEMNPFVRALRDNGLIALLTCAGAVGGALVARMLRRPSRRFPGRVLLFLVGALVLGPGLLVNVVLKDHWDRPRPTHVFRENMPYVNWWDPRGSCERNCSFVSGEVASAAWMFAPAMLAPPAFRVAAFAGAALFTAVISFSRMAAGGHFFTDTVFAALLMTLLLVAMHRLIFRWRRPAADKA
jgi:membrane-associated PAP2 superfamily phosphatase